MYKQSSGMYKELCGLEYPFRPGLPFLSGISVSGRCLKPALMAAGTLERLSQEPKGALLEACKTNTGLRVGNNAPSFRLANMTCIMRDQGLIDLSSVIGNPSKASRILVQNF